MAFYVLCFSLYLDIGLHTASYVFLIYNLDNVLKTKDRNTAI